VVKWRGVMIGGLLVMCGCSSAPGRTYKMDAARESELAPTVCQDLRANNVAGMDQAESYLQAQLGLPAGGSGHDGKNATDYWIKIAKDNCPDTIDGSAETRVDPSAGVGATEYADAGAVAAALDAGGLQCGYADAGPYSSDAVSQVSCTPDGTDEVLIISYNSPGARDAHAQFLMQDGVSSDDIVLGPTWLIDCDLASDCATAAQITSGSNPH
jgi:hypothetical protein